MRTLVALMLVSGLAAAAPQLAFCDQAEKAARDEARANEHAAEAAHDARKANRAARHGNVGYAEHEQEKASEEQAEANHEANKAAEHAARSY